MPIPSFRQMAANFLGAGYRSALSHAAWATIYNALLVWLGVNSPIVDASVSVLEAGIVGGLMAGARIVLEYAGSRVNSYELAAEEYAD